ADKKLSQYRNWTKRRPAGTAAGSEPWKQMRRCRKLFETKALWWDGAGNYRVRTKN
ncbi:hypothetical protein AnigIFM56816_003867, partial [Aspergillus niger]